MQQCILYHRLMAVLEYLEDLKIDYPFACKFLAEIIVIAIKANKLSITFLDEACQELKKNDVDLIASGVAAELFVEIVRRLQEHVSTT